MIILCSVLIVLLIWSLISFGHISNELEAVNLENLDLIKENKKLSDQVPEQKRLMKESLENKLNELNIQFSKDHVHTISQALSGPSSVLLQQQMKNIVERTYSRMSQEFIGNIGDETDTFLSQLKVDLCDKIWDSFQQVKVRSEDPPLVMPEGTKVAYTKGVRTVIVVEQKPQIRSVTFSSSILSVKEREHGTKRRNGYRFSLAFPYVYFFIAFDNNHFRLLQVYFRNKPLTSPREHVYLAPLPNIWTAEGAGHEKSVCMGKDFSTWDEGPVARQAQKVISDFWQRTFNGHLGRGDSTDKRISNYIMWQEKSAEDPLFVLNMKWGKGETVKKTMMEILEDRSLYHDKDIFDVEIKHMLENGVKKVVDKIKVEIKSANKNHTLRAGQIDDLVKETLKDVVCDHSQKVFKNCSNI